MQLPCYGIFVGTCNALGIGFSPLLAPILELIAFEPSDIDPSKPHLPLATSLGCDDIVTLGVNSRIGIPCQVESCIALASIG